jgi:hypothetical protein
MRVHILILNFLFFIAPCQAQTESTLLTPELLPSTESKIFLLLIDQDSIIVGPSTYIYNPRVQFSDSDDIYLIDFGVNYDINSLKYFNYKRRLFILYFLTESDSDYTVLCSFDYKILMKGNSNRIDRSRRVFRMPCCYDLINYTFNKNILNLRFQNNSFIIDLDKDLKSLNYLNRKNDQVIRKENRDFKSGR